MRRLQNRLLVLGNIGYDVYVVAKDRIFVRPAGSAYNIACGTLAVNGSATVIANVGRSLNREYLAKFKGTDVRIVSIATGDGPDNVFLFDLRGDSQEPALDALFSVGGNMAGVLDTIAVSPFQDIHVHMGTMPPASALTLLVGLRAKRPRSSYSCNLYSAYLSANLESAFHVIRECSIVLINLAELELLQDTGRLQSVMDGKIVVITCGAKGAICYVDGIPTVAYTPRPRSEICAVGAGDVFAGSFLAALMQRKDVSQALAAAVEVSALSVEDYGVERIIAFRSDCGRDELARLASANDPAIPLCSPEELLQRDAVAVHETVVEAVGLFVVRADTILLVRKPDDRCFQPGLLYIPGGKLNPQESPEACAKRELKEETGLEAERLTPLGVVYFPDPRNNCRLYRFHQFLITSCTGEPIPADDVVECIWMPFKSINKGDLFPLTWAQLFIGQFLGTFAHADGN